MEFFVFVIILNISFKIASSLFSNLRKCIRDKFKKKWQLAAVVLTVYIIAAMVNVVLYSTLHDFFHMNSGNNIFWATVNIILGAFTGIVFEFKL